AAMGVLDSIDLDSGAPADRALLLAWGASVAYRRGDVAAAARLSIRALGEARASSDEGALAAALNASGVAESLAGNMPAAADHYAHAVEAARRAGDRVEECRGRNNIGSLLLEQSRYAEALVELNAAIDLAEAGPFPKFQALALMNRGLAHWCLGRLDEANA